MATALASDRARLCNAPSPVTRTDPGAVSSRAHRWGSSSSGSAAVEGVASTRVPFRASSVRTTSTSASVRPCRRRIAGRSTTHDIRPEGRREEVGEAPAQHGIEDDGRRRPGLSSDETADDDVGIDDSWRRGHFCRRRAARVSFTARATAAVSRKRDRCRACATSSAAPATVLIPARSRHSSMVAPTASPTSGGFLQGAVARVGEGDGQPRHDALVRCDGPHVTAEQTRCSAPARSSQ